MVKEEFSVRDRKAAKLKLLILSHTKELLVRKNFNDIHVTEICKSVGISKVTFFRYFPQKEDILLYGMRIWAFETSIKIKDKALEGLKAVTFIFERYGELCEKYNSMVLHLIKYYAVAETVLKPISIKKAEKTLLYPQNADIQNFEVLAFDKLLEKHLLEAIFKTEVTRSSDVNDMVRMLLTITYGSILVAKMKQLPVKALLKKNITAVLETF
ncbi:hypothetical protein GCM10011506_42910 [Marivirga lumbricoides]|uniref:HTH tetR-type domain-containing protein n=2 Tax=Marivirga lumbricoides TaxID=1046115 RepID=A0ABQ1NAH9_9BACT|nr:hypothetical protein GCM10011506_42910 [Marivirga lumbricoides]